MAFTGALLKPAVETPDFGRMTGDYVRQGCVICDRFNEWQHRHIIAGNPTVEEQREHREELKRVLRFSKLMHCAASDPDFSDRSVLELLETKIWQMEQAWKLLYQQRSPAEKTEAEDVLREVFPGEPGA